MYLNGEKCSTNPSGQTLDKRGFVVISSQNENYLFYQTMLSYNINRLFYSQNINPYDCHRLKTKRNDCSIRLFDTKVLSTHYEMRYEEFDDV